MPPRKQSKYIASLRYTATHGTGYSGASRPLHPAATAGKKGFLFIYFPHRRRITRDARREIGLGDHDLIVAIDGQREPLTAAGLTAYVFREKRPGSRLTITIRQFGDGSPSPERELVLTVK